ncbi:MAG: putative DNA-binding protein [Clostridia bacterium]|nr:putative DNA-binding protein [Clostridia bacterium]
MDKNLSVSILMDFYGQLLTLKQLDALDLYYNDDLSLSEIADELGISRQGVRDSIKRGEKQLYEFEEKLGLVKRFRNISKNIDKLNSVIDSLSISDCDKDKLNEIKEISKSLSKDL